MTQQLLFLLAALSALTPLSTDIYLAAVPAMADWFEVPLHMVELTISVFLIAFSLGQLVGGPLSDRYGRRITVSGGLALYTLGTVEILMSPTVEWVMLGRILQALGGGVASVNSSAIVRDLSSGREGAANLVRIFQVVMIAPLLAPTLGMLILKFSTWQTIFAVLTVYSASMLVIAMWKLPETSISSNKTNPFIQYWSILKERRIWGLLACGCASFAAMVTFITSSPTVYMGYFGLSEEIFPFAFGANLLCLLVMSRLNLKLLSRYSPLRLVWYGQGLQVLFGGSLLIYMLVVVKPELWVVMPLVMASIGSNALVASNSMASITELFPHSSASATALTGALRFLVGGVIAGLAGVLSDGTPMIMVSVMAACYVSGVLLRLLNFKMLPQALKFID